MDKLHSMKDASNFYSSHPAAITNVSPSARHELFLKKYKHYMKIYADNDVLLQIMSKRSLRNVLNIAY